LNHPLIGKVVSIIWKDPESDWNNYKVLYVDYPLLRLQGIPQDGVDYKDGPMWVDFQSIDCIVEKKEDGS